MRKKFKTISLWVVLLLPYIGSYGIYQWYHNQLKYMENATIVLISKQDMQMRLINYRGKEILKVPVATGLNPGNKQKKGDMKTPEGVFFISDIQDASDWEHDFMDGMGKVRGAYGPYFIRLNTPGYQGIGIHGTHASESVGSRATEGCIRLHNDDLRKIAQVINPSTVVIITPGKDDIGAADTLLRIRKSIVSITKEREKTR